MPKEVIEQPGHYLCGAEAIGFPVRDDSHLQAMIKRGLESTILTRLYDMGLSREVVRDSLQYPDRGTLTPEDTLNVLRLAQITSQALKAFPDRESALTWLDSTQAQLGGERPLVVAVRSDDDLQQVKSTLSRLHESHPSIPYS